jgi:hypothetical protein
VASSRAIQYRDPVPVHGQLPVVFEFEIQSRASKLESRDGESRIPILSNIVTGSALVSSIAAENLNVFSKTFTFFEELK